MSSANNAMNRAWSEHPGLDRLMHYSDGELAVREAAEVRSHLDACWECRSELAGLEQTMADCVRYRKSVLRDMLPPPPAPWADLSDRFAAADKAMRRGSPWMRLRRTIGTAAVLFQPRILMPAATTAMAALLVITSLRNPPAVQAAELLGRAVQAERAKPVPAKRIRIKASTAAGTRTVTRVAGTKTRAAMDAAAIEPVAKLFEAAHYDFDDPLSANAYSNWHGSLAAKSDRVSEDRAGSYGVETTTSASELVEATLRIRRDDLRAVEGTFVFRNHERVEVTDLGDAPSSLTIAAAPLPRPDAAGPSPGPAAPAPIVPAPIEPSAGPGDELAVLGALRRLDADLGEPVEVARTGARVVVTAVGLDRPRREQIESGLRGLPRVELRFEETGSGAAASSEQGGLTVRASASPLQASLEKHLGGRPALDSFTGDILEQTEALVARAHAMRRLEQKFPHAGMAELAAADRTLLRSLERDHAAAMLRHASLLDRRLTPVLTALGAAPASSPPRAAVSADELLRAARRFEQSLSFLFGPSPHGGPPGELPETALRNLRSLVSQIPVE